MSSSCACNPLSLGYVTVHGGGLRDASDTCGCMVREARSMRSVLGRLGGVLGRLGASWGRLGGVLGAFWGCLGAQFLCGETVCGRAGSARKSATPRAKHAKRPRLALATHCAIRKWQLGPRGKPTRPPRVAYCLNLAALVAQTQKSCLP